MNLDIRTPIGGLFAIVGLILVIFGVMTTGQTDMYVRSLGINMNIIWGAVMLVFGTFMLVLGKRAA